MIQATDLRIGNWVIGENTHPTQIRAYDFEHTDFDKIDHIPLTPDILKKCGFKKNNWDMRLESDSMGMIEFIQDKYTFYLYINREHKEPYSHIQYLHQLQNLYKALTNEEITINL